MSYNLCILCLSTTKEHNHIQSVVVSIMWNSSVSYISICSWEVMANVSRTRHELPLPSLYWCTQHSTEELWREAHAVWQGEVFITQSTTAFPSPSSFYCSLFTAYNSPEHPQSCTWKLQHMFAIQNYFSGVDAVETDRPLNSAVALSRLHMQHQFSNLYLKGYYGMHTKTRLLLQAE